LAKTHKDQHFIPQSYLLAWTDPSTPVGHKPYVHLFTKDGSEHTRKAPKNIFSVTDLYTLKMPDGRRDLRIEKGFSGLKRASPPFVASFLMFGAPCQT
jgi:hypothetical protein